MTMSVEMGTITTPLTVYPYGAEPELNHFYRLDYSGEVEEVYNTVVGQFTLPLLSQMDVDNHATVHGEVSLRVPLPSRKLLLEVVDHFKECGNRPSTAYVIWNVDHYEIMWGVNLDDFNDTVERFVFMKLHSVGNQSVQPYAWNVWGNTPPTKTGLYGVVGEVDRLTPTAQFYMSAGGRLDGLPFVPFNGDVETIVYVK
jgi:hypothetical protein